MKLKNILNFAIKEQEWADLEICDLSLDSRQVQEKTLFFALKGSQQNGHQFIAEAYEKGAAMVVSEEQIDREVYANRPFLQVENIRDVLAQAAARFYVPQVKNIIAVTGTSGKTSVVSFLRQIWEQSGYSAASMGTTGVISIQESHPVELTTPDTITIHKMLRQLAQHNITHLAMEASSHGLDQYRLDGVQLLATGFTNFGRDHLDYHETKEAYFEAKMGLFERVLPAQGVAVIFTDDDMSDQVIERVQKAGRQVRTVGRKGDFIQLKRTEHARFKQEIELVIDQKIYEIELPLAGEFQVSNILVALGLAFVSGVSVEEGIKALKYLSGVPGRLQLVGFTPSHSPVYIDYAHKPEALENVLCSVRPFTTGRVILVFGCGGDRDKGKRPIMGGIADKLADVVVITDDNPRSEEAAQIRAEILQAVPQAHEIADRGEAIKFAIEQLKEGDSLIIAGKGHEEGQIIGDKVVAFSDYDQAKRRLSQLISENNNG